MAGNRDLLKELRAYAEGEAEQLNRLSLLLSTLQPEQITFDTDAIWARVEEQLGAQPD